MKGSTSFVYSADQMRVHRYSPTRVSYVGNDYEYWVEPAGPRLAGNGGPDDDPPNEETKEGAAMHYTLGGTHVAGGGKLLGGGNQVFIPRVDPKWVLP